MKYRAGAIQFYDHLNAAFLVPYPSSNSFAQPMRAQCGASEGDDFFRHAVPPPTPLRDLRLSRYVAPLSTFRIPFNPEIFVEFTSALSRISWQRLNEYTKLTRAASRNASEATKISDVIFRSIRQWRFDAKRTHEKLKKAASRRAWIQPEISHYQNKYTGLLLLYYFIRVRESRTCNISQRSTLCIIIYFSRIFFFYNRYFCNIAIT